MPASALGTDDDPGWVQFWATYPRRTAKGAARAAWAKAIRNGADPAVLIKAAAVLRDQPGRNPKYTPHPATWLNQQRWEDDVATAAPMARQDVETMRGLTMSEHYRQQEAGEGQ